MVLETVWRMVPKPCQLTSLDSCQKRFLWAHKETDLILHTLLVLCSKSEMWRSFKRHFVSKAWILLLLGSMSHTHREGWTTPKTGCPLVCWNCSQWPPAEKTKRWSLLSCPSCSPWQGKGLKWTELNIWDVRAVTVSGSWQGTGLASLTSLMPFIFLLFENTLVHSPSFKHC